MRRSNQGPGPDQTTYQIKVQGRLDENWSDWFNGTTILCENDSGGPTVTTLTVAADQTKLRGILSKIWDLNLTVISVNPIESGEGKPVSQTTSQTHSRQGGQ
jgi:hypothetical protein